MPFRSPQHRPHFLRPRADAERDRKRAHDRTRPNANARGYDAEWQRGRAEYLAEHPLCSEPGCTKFAVDVDHIVSVRDRPDLRMVRSNWRGFCRPHHSARTARDQGFARKRDDTTGADRETNRPADETALATAGTAVAVPDGTNRKRDEGEEAPNRAESVPFDKAG